MTNTAQSNSAFLAVIARRYHAVCESNTDDGDGWVQRTYLFPRFPEHAREDFVHDFNASNNFQSFNITFSQTSPRLYLEYKN
jgi:hypothetical protein